MDLIYAEATPPGRGGVSIVRISGNGARQLAERLGGALPEARRTYLRRLVEDGEVLDQAMLIRFDEKASFTGEECVELHLHGAPVVVRRVARALERGGARLAEAGEFSRRALLNGRMDLVEVEGLGDLLAAETEAQRQLAMRTASGELAQRAVGWREKLIRAGALIEASVDFADEDVPDDVPAEVFDLVGQLIVELQRELAGFQAAERVRLGFEVAIIGPPNAGKSTLMNRLADRTVALVSEIAGTTRDVIEMRYDLNGLAVTFLDTAGLREAGDAIEAMGIGLARDRARLADLRIHLSPDGGRVDDLWQEGDLLVRSKADLSVGGTGLMISAAAGDGLDDLLAELSDRLRQRVSQAGVISHDRQRQEIALAVDSLNSVAGQPAELAAEHIRAAAASLDRLLGRIGSEDYLDVIFASFCIGK
ncbi:tRNA uridine-5-carboxymethylaminomethyl(34) synthesis GTPase MnmE [Paracoccus sp. (in: a-proteobacteria)]|uniref:tRNA uridine-5-carboxymethylaminomethyl(34) synthesis GTPase MnmE n=1 Tax=Paracoccus sp. TaxID=267 RepID=UPI00272CB61E|nr:tRNA uridine-5-carboxymethylaminomethyl(34) synthesis GTPase MnmE [Paracoccus sp. (in: a-proteobacteria)]